MSSSNGEQHQRLQTSSPSMFQEDPSESSASEELQTQPGPRKTPRGDKLAKKKSEIDITLKEYFDFMKSAYQLYEGVDSETIDWDELLQTSVFKNILGNCGGAADRNDAQETPGDFPDHGLKDQRQDMPGSRKNSLTLSRRRSLNSRKDSNMDGSNIETILRSKLNDVLGEGILDSILPYLVGNAKPVRTASSHQPIIKRLQGLNAGTDLKKGASFSGFSTERDAKEKQGIPSRDRLGRRKSSISLEKNQPKLEGEVEIHVCDEVKGLKRDFRCPQRLLVSKMGYFADVTSGQRLDDMDISVHCDIQIFDWLMRWVKKDTILVADWPILDPNNVIPILVSASFLQMDPLLHDCLIYCHSHLNEIVKSSTNLACINDTLLTRLADMYTNSELEQIKDKKDKIQWRLFCRMIMSLCEPVPETIRGHYSSLSTTYKCSKDQNWNISEYITRLHGELKSWRRVYWRLWGESHFFKCSVCSNYFPVYQTEWCCYHPDSPQYFGLDPQRGSTLPVGRFPCCGERAYRFEVLTHTTGCQFRDHMPDMTGEHDSAILNLYNSFKELISMAPPQLMFPERLSRLVARDPADESGRLLCREAFWWDGLSLAPARATLGLLGRLYSGGAPKHPPNLAAASPSSANPNGKAKKEVEKPFPVETAVSSINGGKKTTLVRSATLNVEDKVGPSEGGGDSAPAAQAPPRPALRAVHTSSGSDDSDSSSSSSESGASGAASPTSAGEEDDPAPARNAIGMKGRGAAKGRNYGNCNRRRVWRNGRQWASSLSARSNQDQQRRFEERAARNMKITLARRTLPGYSAVTVPVASKSKNLPSAPNYIPPGGIYSRLECEWRELHCPTTPASQLRSRNAFSAKAIRNKFATK